MPSKGKKQTKEHIAKRMVGARKGWFKKGQRTSIDTEYKKGIKPKGNEKGHFRDGEEHLFWKGGISGINRRAKTRDDYTCQICGLRDIEIIEVDHIKPKSKYPKLKYDVDNLMCLCPNCHRRKTLRERKSMVGG